MGGSSRGLALTAARSCSRAASRLACRAPEAGSACSALVRSARQEESHATHHRPTPARNPAWASARLQALLPLAQRSPIWLPSPPGAAAPLRPLRVPRRPPNPVPTHARAAAAAGRPAAPSAAAGLPAAAGAAPEAACSLPSPRQQPLVAPVNLAGGAVAAPEGTGLGAAAAAQCLARLGAPPSFYMAPACSCRRHRPGWRGGCSGGSTRVARVARPRLCGRALSSKADEPFGKARRLRKAVGAGRVTRG